MSLGTALRRSPVVAPAPPLPPAFPRVDERDSTVALLREGYAFGRRRFTRLGTDAFRARIGGRHALFTYGEDAARLLYRGHGLTRRNALPAPVLTLLLDVGSVAMLEGEAHRHRKAMFLALLGPDSVERLADLFELAWRERLPRWEGAGEVVLLDEAHAVLTEAVCGWAGLDLSPGELDARRRDFAAMVAGAGRVGPRNLVGHALRARCERALRHVVRDVRAGRRQPPPGSPLEVVATHRELDGRLLPVEVAAVELINLLRPTVAVARFIAFAAHALHVHVDDAARTRLGEDGDARQRFAQEVRRWYPFFPVVAARVTDDITWRGQPLAPGSLVLLDVLATNRDARLWEDAEAFRPERFAGREIGPYELVPQGGGEHATTHRCPGEWPALALVDRAVRLLTTAMTYTLPPQDLSLRLGTMPGRPASGIVLSEVHPR